MTLLGYFGFSKCWKDMVSSGEALMHACPSLFLSSEQFLAEISCLVYWISRTPFKATCTTAFFAFLRVGEITSCRRSPTVLQLSQMIQLVDNFGDITGSKINFSNFKLSYNQPRISFIPHRRSDIGPVQTLLDYFACRSLFDGPLFRAFVAQAVTRRR